jgi:ribonuclease G
MTKELVISSNRHETKVAILEDDQLVEVYFQRSNEYSLVGSIHKGRVTRVLPGMQSAFVNLGLERDAFLYVSDFFEQAGEDYDRVGADERPRRAESRMPPPPIATLSAGPVADSQSMAEPAAESLPDAAPAVASREPARERAERNDDRGRRGRRSRRRRGRGRGFPESKYAAPTDAAAAPPESEEEEDAELPAEALILPGESIAKYQSRQLSDVEEEEPAAAAPADDAAGEAGDAAHDATAPPVPEPVLVTKELKEEVKQLVDELDEEAALDAAQEAAEAALAAEQETSADLPEPTVASVEVVATSGEPGIDDLSDAEAESFAATVAELEDADEIEAEADVEAAALEEAEAAALEDSDAGTPPESEEAASETEAGSAAEPETEAGAGGEETLDAGAGADTDEPEEASAELREEQPAARYIQRGNRRIRRRGGRPERPDARPERRDAPEARLVSRPEREARPERQERSPSSRPEREKPPLPSISDLLKEGQEIIVQIFKEPLGQKGARITSHIAMPGRYVVYMPTLDHLGVSRKVASDEERARLKRIVQTHAAGMTGGFIVRTAGEGKSEAEIAADMTFLYNQWLDIRKRAEKRPAPVLLHHDLELITRTLRDQVNEQFKAIWVDTEEVYEKVVGFLERFQPALVNRVRLYTRDIPIFDTFNITAELEKALRPKVWLKSGGYIVVNQTEALVAVDINTGKFVGKSNRLEDTIVKTNLEAVKEIVRQIRLRDLGGIIVIDFIDMDERKNRQKVMQALEEAMRADRAPYKILQFNDFGLVAITRRRVKQSLERALCQPCPTCEGAGYVKSVQTVVGEILTEAYKIAPALEGKDVLLRVHPDVAKELKRAGENYIAELEEILGRTLIVKSDPLLHPEKFDLA